MRKNNLLIIFVKAPRPGTVKTRLNSHFSVENSLRFYKAMVEDLIGHFEQAAGFDTKILVWPPEGMPEVRSWLGRRWSFAAQTEGNLGQKMHRAFLQGFVAGYQKVIIIGSDLPELTEANLDQAFNKLNETDMVLGPSSDGGYYLIGLKKPQSKLFENVMWSSAFVLGQTLSNAQDQKVKVSLLEEKTDLDHYNQVLNFWRGLNNGSAGDKKSLLPNSYHILSEIFLEKQTEEKPEKEIRFGKYK